MFPVAQALTKVYQAIFEDDALLEWFVELKQPNSSLLLRAFSSTFAQACGGPNSESFPQWFQDNKEWQPLRETFQLGLKFCRMVLCFLDPAGYGLCGQDVDFFLKFPGKSLFGRTIQNNLLPPTGAKILISLVKDVQRTAASIKEAQPVFQKVAEIVSSKKPSMEDLNYVQQQSAYLQMNLRQNQLVDVLQKFIGHLVERAKKIYQEDVTAGVSSEDVEFLVKTLRKFQKTPAAVDAESKLSAWCSRHNTQLAKQELLGMLTSYVDQATASQAKAEQSMDLAS